MFNETTFLGAVDACAPYVDQIYAAADRYGIDRGIALAQIRQESGCNPSVCSGAGACGIAQFTQGTATRFGLTDRSNVSASLEAWGQYMSQLLGMFGGRYDLALAGYNAGENRASLRAGQVPNIPETQNYVARIMQALGLGGSGPVAPPIDYSGINPTGDTSGGDGSSSFNFLPSVTTDQMTTDFFSGLPGGGLTVLLALAAAYFIFR
jgi:hypothetical protein